MNFTSLKSFMDHLTEWRIPGNSIQVYLGKEKVFEYQSGYASLETREPMTTEHLLNMYSCSKLVTVTAALQLYEQGKFLMSDPVCDFIPEFRSMRVKNPDGTMTWSQHPIKMRQLFTMTSGLDYNMKSAGIQKAHELTGGKMDTLTVARCIAQEDHLQFQPGERWMYGRSHEILAAVVEAISGEKFRDYVQKNIFDPLDMKNSFYHNEGVRDRMAEQYDFKNLSERDLVKLQKEDHSREGGQLVNVGKAVVYHVLGEEYDGGGAGITSSVSDFAKFTCALANNGIGLTGERILAAGTVDLMRRNQLSEEQIKTFDFCGRGYGYGLGVRSMMDKAASGSIGNVLEFGWNGAAGASAVIDTDIGLAAFYSHHMLNPQEGYYQPRLRNLLYKSLS